MIFCVDFSHLFNPPRRVNLGRLSGEGLTRVDDLTNVFFFFFSFGWGGGRMCVYETVPYFFGGTEYFEDRLGGYQTY